MPVQVFAQVPLHGELLPTDVARWPRSRAVRLHVRPQRVRGLQLRPTDGTFDRLVRLAAHPMVFLPRVRTKERLRAALDLALERSNVVVLIHVVTEPGLIRENPSALLAGQHPSRSFAELPVHSQVGSAVKDPSTIAALVLLLRTLTIPSFLLPRRLNLMLFSVMGTKLTLPHKLLAADVTLVARFSMAERVLRQGISGLKNRSANIAHHLPRSTLLLSPAFLLVRQASLRRVESLRATLGPASVRSFAVVFEHVVPELGSFLKLGRAQMAHLCFALDLFERCFAVLLVRLQMGQLDVSLGAPVAAVDLGRVVVFGGRLVVFRIF